MSASERVLEIVKAKGPLLPVEIAKAIDTNIIMASAFLSELTSNKKVKISSVKVGGSPVYYVVGQESKLQEFYKYLHEKERKTFNLLKEKKVLDDLTQEPVVRAALRQIKDFAKPVEVNIKGEKKLFWKWYLVPNEEISSLIKGNIGLGKTIKQETTKKDVFEHKKPEEQKQEPKKEQEEQKEHIQKQEEPKKELFVDKTTTDEFLSKIKSYFTRKEIIIIDQKIIRKNSDIEFTVKVPTSVGSQVYYCRAKNKKRCNDGDLSSAYVKGEFKKHPTLFLTTGDFTKKAKEMLSNEFKNMNIQGIN